MRCLPIGAVALAMCAAMARGITWTGASSTTWDASTANWTDGTSAVALAELLLDEGEAARAIEVLRAAAVSPDLLHAEAVLETRALRFLGRRDEATARWRRYLEARKGAARQWVG